MLVQIHECDDVFEEKDASDSGRCLRVLVASILK